MTAHQERVPGWKQTYLPHRLVQLLAQASKRLNSAQQQWVVQALAVHLEPLVGNQGGT